MNDNGMWTVQFQDILTLLTDDESRLEASDRHRCLGVVTEPGRPLPAPPEPRVLHIIHYWPLGVMRTDWLVATSDDPVIFGGKGRDVMMTEDVNESWPGVLAFGLSFVILDGFFFNIFILYLLLDNSSKF